MKLEIPNRLKPFLDENYNFVLFNDSAEESSTTIGMLNSVITFQQIAESDWSRFRGYASLITVKYFNFARLYDYKYNGKTTYYLTGYKTKKSFDNDSNGFVMKFNTEKVRDLFLMANEFFRSTKKMRRSVYAIEPNRD